MPTIEGTVERIVFRNEENGYTVARIQTNDNTRLFRDELLTVVGTLGQIAIGELIECTGDWELDPAHGRQLHVTRFITHTPISPKALARYLGSGIIKGIGPKTAERITDHFGEQTLAIIELESERLTEIKGISAAKRDAIIAGWQAQRSIRELMVFLQSHDVTPALARKIFNQYGQEAIATIKENPYQLEHDIHGVGFKTADAIAVSLGLPRDSVPRLATGIKYALTEASSNGHCYLPVTEALLQAAILLEVQTGPLVEAMQLLVQQKEAFLETTVAQPVLDSVESENLGTPADMRPLYLSPFFYSEVGVARKIRALQRAESILPPLTQTDLTRLVAQAEADHNVPLAEHQREAIIKAYTSKVSILTGGPGTGKTTTIRALVHLLDQQKAVYALAAPTGRAARRITETTGRPASTLHRLLEFLPNGNTFARNEERPLTVDMLIVDEVSMVDIILMYNLLKALAPETHLLLVGDADQLPSVGPGNVLHDLIASDTVAVTHLTELFRQAAQSRIIVAAHDIREGRIPDTTPSSTSDFFVMPVTSPEAASALVVDLVTRRLPATYGVHAIHDIQVLAPMYKGSAGVTALNDLLQQRLRQHHDGGAVTSGSRTFHVGDKVMQLRNDYDKNVFNGDVGMITVIDSQDSLVVVRFGEGGDGVTVSYGYHELDELTLAYAVSIHRAQGSEYPVLVLPLVMQHALLLQRNLLYTAITRARRLCVVVAEPRAFARAVQNNEVTRRNTALTERLQQLASGLQPSRRTLPKLLRSDS